MLTRTEALVLSKDIISGFTRSYVGGARALAEFILHSAQAPLAPRGALPIDDIDPGIRTVVEWLNVNGFITTDSGDGFTKLAKGLTLEDGVLDFPHVFIKCGRDDLLHEADRLHLLLMEKGLMVNHGEHIQATYDPVDQSAILALFRIGDAVFERGTR